MNPEPPSASARLYASTAAATGTICSQAAAIEPKRPATTTIAAATVPATSPPTSPVADLLDDEPEGA